MTADTRKDTDASELTPFRDLSKMFEQFKMPSVDGSAFVEARRKDVEALVAANKVTYEALQGLARAQTDMLTQVMQGMQDSAKSMMSGSAGGKETPQHAEAAQQAWQKMLTDMKDLAERVQKSQVQAMAGLTERATENIKQMQGQSDKS
ncbi:phasin family protein [Aquabacterium sp.]|uniref:phasin family protein n=1 Tax=Aquabacterium sp. TaxID=1872578 RepID=UPI002B6CC180|nr:phasin family protein [Aquabacterium sp.]HSW07402.1 phasin family protein [Aquabacterium sp.]